MVVSGLKLNLAKSEIFHIGDVKDIENLAWILSYKIGTLSSSYLGMPLGVTFKSKVIKGIVGRLESWRAFFFSFEMWYINID